jgi:hypothetical protein
MLITEFLDKRLKEDLVGAAITPPNPAWHDRMNHSEHLVRVIATLRRIVDDHSEGYGPTYDDRPRQKYCIRCGSGDGNGEVWPCEEVRSIASLYASHPVFEEGWKV